MRIPVPHFQQETPHTCLPACVRMVLSYLGDEQTERQLASAFQTVPGWGTLPEHVETTYNGPKNLDSETGKNKVLTNHAQTI